MICIGSVKLLMLMIHLFVLGDAQPAINVIFSVHFQQQ